MNNLLQSQVRSGLGELGANYYIDKYTNIILVGNVDVLLEKADER